MKTKTKRRICRIWVAIAALALVGLTGSCECGDISLKAYVISCAVIIAASIIPACKSGLFN